MFQRLICLACIAMVMRGASAADGWKPITAENGLPGNEIQFLKQDESGAVWIGTLQGLGVFRDGKFSIAVKDKQIFDVAPAGGGRHWVGTGDGVLLLDGGKAQEQLKGFLVAPLVAYDAKTTWAISKDKKTEENKLVANDGSGWTDVERFKAEKVVDVNRTPGGTLWVTIDGNGAYAVDPAKGAAQAVWHLKGLNVNVIFEDSKKRTWAGLWGGGVRIFDGKEWASHLPKEKSTIFAIKEDSRGNIWVATNANGLWKYDGTNWTNDLKEEGSVNMLATTSDGKVWISTQSEGGLRAADDGKWKSVIPGPLPIRCMIETKDKKVWAGGVLDGLHVQQ